VNLHWVFRLAAILALGFGGARAADVIPAWQLVWADEFDQAEGSGPDPAKWGFDLGGGGWGNHELQTYTDRRVNARIEGGRLVIEARRETFTGSDGRTRDYTSARLKTRGKASWTFGRIEARIQIPRGQGIWPAFWMLGNGIGTVGWPACGEIDIMENIGREPTLLHGAIHGPGFSGGDAVGSSTGLAGQRLADAFHLYAIEWTPDRIRWLADNQPFFSATRASLPAGATWVFDRPHFLLLNVAVGGDWPGPPNATTPLPQSMRVEYVRVYAATQAPRPTLRVVTHPDRVEVRWPALFPQARVQQTPAPGQPWRTGVPDGQMGAGEFWHRFEPGLLRLMLPGSD
jgi:beta-glucanase (GH16 family)